MLWLNILAKMVGSWIDYFGGKFCLAKLGKIGGNEVGRLLPDFACHSSSSHKSKRQTERTHSGGDQSHLSQ
jgi:hypothetical protein